MVEAEATAETQATQAQAAQPKEPFVFKKQTKEDIIAAQHAAVMA